MEPRHLTPLREVLSQRLPSDAAAEADSMVVSWGVVWDTDSPPTRDVAVRCATAFASHASSGGLGVVTIGADGRASQRGPIGASDAIDAWIESFGAVGDTLADAFVIDRGLGELGYSVMPGKFSGPPSLEMRGHLRVARGSSDSVAEGLVQVLQACQVECPFLTGFVHVDSAPDPYSWLMTAETWLSEDNFVRQLHGYYWCGFLSEGHRALLGDLGALSEVVDSVDVLEPSDSAVMYRLTPRPSMADEGAYLALRNVLQSVLRPGCPTTPTPTPPSGAITALTWVFEGPAIPRAVLRELRTTRSWTPPAGFLSTDHLVGAEALVTIELSDGDAGLAANVIALVRAWLLSIRVHPILAETRAGHADAWVVNGEEGDKRLPTRLRLAVRVESATPWIDSLAGFLHDIQVDGRRVIERVAVASMTNG